MTETVRIDFGDDSEAIAASAAFRILETFAAAAQETPKPVAEDVRTRMEYALQDFPELAHETINVGWLDPDATEERDVVGRARPRNNMVLLPADRLSSFMTIYHELGHLAIEQLDEDGGDAPTTSEEFCSIFSVARMPADLIDEDYIGYLGEPSVPQGEWPDICQRALEYREDNHNYIQQAKAWLRVDEGGGRHD